MLLFLLLFTHCAFINSTKGLFQMQILHNNDMHANFYETDVYSTPCSEEEKKAQQCYGGFARTKAAIDRAIKEADFFQTPSLVLNVGDSFPGTLYYSLKKSAAAPLVDSLQFMVTTLGNHEFDDGIDNLVDFITNLKTPIVCCNLDLDSEPRLRLQNLKPSIVLKIGGQKIGIIGSVTPETMRMSKTENLKILDEITCIRAEAKRLKEDGVNIIISLSHSGFDVDLKIAEAISDLSLIVGGHTHTFLYSPTNSKPSIESPEETYPFIVEHPSGKKIPIVQAYAYTKYLGRLMVIFDDNGDVVHARGNPQLLDSTIPEDETVKDILYSWLEPLRAHITEVVARTRLPLEQANFRAQKFTSTLGNLVTDAIVDYANSEVPTIARQSSSTAFIAFVNKFSVHGELGNFKGSITQEDIMAVVPFGSPIWKVDFPGWVIKEALEYSMVKKSDDLDFPNFLYFSGLKVVYNLSKPEFERVEEIQTLRHENSKVEYENLDIDRWYTVLLPKFLTEEISGYKMFVKTAQNVESLNVKHKEILRYYLNKVKYIEPTSDGRLMVQYKRARSLDKNEIGK